LGREKGDQILARNSKLKGELLDILAAAGNSNTDGKRVQFNNDMEPLIANTE
jgi:hypothetical protein